MQPDNSAKRSARTMAGNPCMMNDLSTFTSSPELKFAVITRASFDADPVAQQLSTSPAIIIVDNVELVILSIPTDKVIELAAYAEQIGSGIEFDLNVGSGKVTLLLHSKALLLLTELSQIRQDPPNNLLSYSWDKIGA